MVQTLLAEMFKRLVNSSYGKLIEGLERQTTVKYTKSESALGKDVRWVWFQDLEEFGDEYKIEIKVRQVEIDRPFQVGIAVYQIAKPRVLNFYYDCLDKLVDRCDESIQVDTDSL